MGSSGLIGPVKCKINGAILPPPVIVFYTKHDPIGNCTTYPVLTNYPQNKRSIHPDHQKSVDFSIVELM